MVIKPRLCRRAVAVSPAEGAVPVPAVPVPVPGVSVSVAVAVAVSSTAAVVEAGAADGQEEMRTPAQLISSWALTFEFVQCPAPSTQHERTYHLTLSHAFPLVASRRIVLGWVGLGWVGLGWVGLGWVGLGWVGVGHFSPLSGLCAVGSVHSASPAAAPSPEAQTQCLNRVLCWLMLLCSCCSCCSCCCRSVLICAVLCRATRDSDTHKPAPLSRCF